MWLSVSRAGPVFEKQGRFIPRDDRAVECVLYLAPGGVESKVRVHLERFMRGYANASGWSVQSLRFTKRYAALVMAPSRALSKASRKP